MNVVTRPLLAVLAVTATATMIACGTAPPPPSIPRGSWTIKGVVDGKPLDDLVREVEAGRVPLPDLKVRMEREPQLALALATERSFVRLWERGQYAAAVYLAQEWVSLSGTGLSTVISSPGSFKEGQVLALLTLLAPECPRGCRLNPGTSRLVERDWVRVAKWVAARHRGRDIWEVEDDVTGETLMNRARSAGMRELLASQGVMAKSPEELAAYAALRRQRQAESEAEEREYQRRQREYRRRQEEEEEAERREQRWRDEERAAERAASARAQQETWRRINDKLDNLVSETRATNEEILRNARDAQARAEARREEERRRREAEQEAAAARERDARRRALEAAEERERLARAERDERARRRWEAANAQSKAPPVVVNLPFSGPAVAVSESPPPARRVVAPQPIAGTSSGAAAAVAAPGGPTSGGSTPPPEPSVAPPALSPPPSSPSRPSSPSSPFSPSSPSSSTPSRPSSGGPSSGSGSPPSSFAPAAPAPSGTTQWPSTSPPPSPPPSTGGSARDPLPKAGTSTSPADPYGADPCGLQKCAAPCPALIDNCDPIIPSCFPFRRYNECMKRCAAERACVDRREQEARERLRNNPVKTKSK